MSKPVTLPRIKRARRVRRRLRAVSGERPRLSVFRSGKHIYAQLIDDGAGTTLAAASTLDEDIRKEAAKGSNTSAAAVVGRVLAERCKAKGVKAVVFDRGGYLFHGRVKALADAAREGGIEF